MGASPMMAGMDGYALLDVGGGERLERFGARLVVRPHPGAAFPRRAPDAWAAVDLSFADGRGWSGPEDPWPLTVDGVTLELRATETGQVGFFPEHATLWPWLRDRVHALGRGASVLNLFAYTGATTLALASAGANVAHVDAARPTVAWARRNAALSGLDDRPIRWLVDDATGFVERELRRGRRYDGIVVDPPAYGHGMRGRAWRIETDLEPLLAGCARLAGDGEGFLLLTAHSIGFDADRLGWALAAAIGRPGRDLETGDLVLEAASGARLGLGAFARWPGTR